MTVPPPTLADLKRELAVLHADLVEDAAILDRCPEGRWPMAHRLARLVDYLETRGVSHG